MKYRVSVLLDDRQNLYHAAKLHAGLSGLAAQGMITYDLKAPDPAEVTDPTTLLLQVYSLERKERRSVVVDLRDQSNVFTDDALRLCDVYFKRSYYLPDLDALPGDVRSKVVPFGLNHGCASPSSRRKCLSALAARYVRVASVSPRVFISRLHTYLRTLRAYCLTPNCEAFEQGPEVELEPLVFYQTRVWQAQESTDDLEEVNEQRVTMIRVLKKEFRHRFLGGLVPTEFARRRFPDVLTNQPSRRTWYPRVAKRGLIGIYTRGLHHSLAFKLAEYLAAAKCIVSEPLRNELPTPLLEEQNFLQFGSPQECVEQCERLLRDRELASSMRRHNYAYYRSEVCPSAHLLKCLDRAFSGSHFP